MAGHQIDIIFPKLGFQPILSRIFMVGLAGNTLLPHSEEKIGAVSFTIKDQSKAGNQGILLLFEQARLTGNFSFQPRNDFVLQYAKQSRINGFVHHEKGLPVHGIHPVIRGRPQAELLSGNVMAGKFCLLAVVYPHMAVYI